MIELGDELKERFKETLEAGDKIKKTSEQIGIATDALQELQYAGSLADLSAEGMAQSVGHLSKNLIAAKEGGEEAKKAFKGIEFKRGDGSLKTSDEVLAAIAERFKQMPDGAEKTAQAMKLFGRAGKQMIPLLNQGAEGLGELRKEAHEFGLVMDKEAIDASEEFNDNVKRLKESTTGLWRQAIAPLIPAMNELVKRWLAWKKANAALIAGKIKEYVGYLISGIKGLANALSFLIRNADFFKAILGQLAVVLLLFSSASIRAALSTAAAWLLAAAPFILISGLIAAMLLIFDDLRVYSKDPTGTHSLFGRFKKQLDDWMKPNANDPWFVTAIKDFVRYIRDAVDAINEFNKLIGKSNAAEIDKMAGATKGQMEANKAKFAYQNAKVRARAGLPLTDAEKNAVERQGFTVEQFMANNAPAVPAGPGAFSAGPSQFNATFNNVMTESQSPQDVASAQRQQFEEWHDSKMEEAAAAAQ